MVNADLFSCPHRGHLRLGLPGVQVCHLGWCYPLVRVAGVATLQRVFRPLPRRWSIHVADRPTFCWLYSGCGGYACSSCRPGSQNEIAKKQATIKPGVPNLNPCESFSCYIYWRDRCLASTLRSPHHISARTGMPITIGTRKRKSAAATPTPEMVRVRSAVMKYRVLMPFPRYLSSSNTGQKTT